MQLAPQRVEVIRRRRWVDDLPIRALLQVVALLRRQRNVRRVFVRVLKEALDAARGVFRTCALVSVRQEADEAALPPPLGLHRAEKVVEDNLRPIRKIAELRLPHHKRLGRLHRVAQLKA